jgi:hypothetical protein
VCFPKHITYGAVTSHPRGFCLASIIVAELETAQTLCCVMIEPNTRNMDHLDACIDHIGTRLYYMMRVLLDFPNFLNFFTFFLTETGLCLVGLV